MGRRRLALAWIAALAGLLALAPAAGATFHEISIREVYPGSLAQPDSDYVVLQMYASDQHHVKNQALSVYGASGTKTGTFTFPGALANGANQQTLLIGDDGVDDAFGVSPDLSSASFALDPAGGAACWAGSLDCVAWGAFSGSAPSASGTPADPLGIPDGKALRRTIQPSCPTLLEPVDDSDDSADDLADATPQPRNNASPITETICTGPVMTIDTQPDDPTKATGASFTYHADQAGASFECRLDTASFAPCDPLGITYAGPLGDGQHTFRLRGKSAAGFLGAAVAYTWEVDTVAPSVTITEKPADPSPGASAPFAFNASEAGSSFQCSLALGAAADDFSACASGQTYTSLADGEYTFKVRATDAATNQGAPAVHEWTVDNSVADVVSPNTVIDSAPLDPSQSSTATFTYHSTEPGSSFECKLDGASFASCPAAGTTYTGLGGGSHTFQVRAVDVSGNTDLTPDGRTFAVVLPTSQTPAATGSETAPATGASAIPAVTTAPRKKRPRVKRCARRKAHAHSTHDHMHRRGKRCKRGKGKARREATVSTFHLVLVREIYPGSAANPNAEYVELQMYAGGQEFVAGHRVEFFNSGGTSLGSVTFGADVARGSSQSTLLIATPEAESQFGVLADEGVSGGKIDPAGGAVCWEALDCVGWGSFSGSLSSSAGAPVDPSGIPDGMALRRTIQPGCPTLLERSDDRDDSATDFADAFPSPRSNSVAPSEQGCASSGGGEGLYPAGDGPGAGDRPRTTLRGHPGKRTRDRTPTFRFTSDQRGAVFLCKLDRQPFKACRSPLTTRRLSLGRHVFQVKARVAGSGTDRSPASWHFKVTAAGS